LTVESPTITQGQPLRVNVSFSDQQGDAAIINFGIAGEDSHSVLSAATLVGQTSGTLMLELKPAHYVPGVHVLMVSITDAAGHVSLAVTAVFTIVGSGGTEGGAVDTRGSDAGCPYGGSGYGQTCGSTDAAVTATCDTVLFDNGNIAACTNPTNTSVFTLPAASTVTYLRLWTNTTISGPTVTYTLLNSAGTILSSGPTTKGGCDPYQTNWCEFLVTTTMSLPAGTYTVKSSAAATCANSGSKNVGHVMVKGCAATTPVTPDAGVADTRTAPTGQEAILFKMESVQGVSYNPPNPTTFTLSSDAYVTRVWDYHYGATIGTKSQTISFKNTTTNVVYGPWPVVGYKTFNGTLGVSKSDPGNIVGPPDNYWMAYPAQTVPAGTYQVIDSDPATWAYTSDLGNRGSTWVYGWLLGTASPVDAGVDAASACSTVLFDNGNIAACTNPTNTSVFALSAPSTVTYLRLWTNTTISGPTVTYTLLDSAGTVLASGPTTKGGCDPYQTNWCEFLVTTNLSLSAGTYTVKSSAAATCANAGSNNVGHVMVKGCAAAAPTVSYFTVAVPPVGVAPAGAKVSAVKATDKISIGGIFWKDGRLYVPHSKGAPIVSVMPGETGTLWANVTALQGTSSSWRHGVPLTGGNILLGIDYTGDSPTGLHEITPAGVDTAWTLARGHSGIGDILALPTGGWVFSDFEGYNIFKVSAKNTAETALIATSSFTPASLAYDAATDTIYFVNMNNLGGESWFSGDGAIYKIVAGGAPTLVANPPAAGTRFLGLAVGLGGLFPAGLYAGDPANGRVVKVDSTGALTPVVTGIPSAGELRIDPVSKGMAITGGDQIVFVLP
jgi:hypothetical protein